MYIQVEDSFSAAHHLPGYEGKCSRIHGHRWVVKVAWIGDADEGSGMVCDFKILKEALHSLLERFDHQDLNYYFNNPTAEFIAEEIFHILKYQKIGSNSLTLAYVIVDETPGYRVMFSEKDYACCGDRPKAEQALLGS
jgi:6-pyruvoyltetrahydropterin/6-carboxytetrahydropterin synthase